MCSYSFRASRYGRLETVKYLHGHGGRLDARDEDAYTPLMCAVWKGKNEIVEYLLQNGAKIDLTDVDMRTVFHLAIDENHADTLQLLISKSQTHQDHEEIVNAVDKDFKTPLHYAAKLGIVQVIFMIILGFFVIKFSRS